MVRDTLERWFELHDESVHLNLPPFDALAGGAGRVPPEVLHSLDLTTDEGMEILVSIYLDGKIPTAALAGKASQVFGIRGPLSGARPATGTGRNQPCPCGSGRKYKHCCGKH